MHGCRNLRAKHIFTIQPVSNITQIDISNGNVKCDITRAHLAHGKHYHFSFIYIYLSCACDSFLQTLRQAERLKMALKAMALSSICTSHRGSFGSTADDEWDELYVLSSFPPFASLPQRLNHKKKRKKIIKSSKFAPFAPHLGSIEVLQDGKSSSPRSRLRCGTSCHLSRLQSGL